MSATTVKKNGVVVLKTKTFFSSTRQKTKRFSLRSKRFADEVFRFVRAERKNKTKVCLFPNFNFNEPRRHVNVQKQNPFRRHAVFLDEKRKCSTLD